MGTMPTVQQLLETSCLSGGLKFEEVPERSSFAFASFLSRLNMNSIVLLCSQVPSCLMVQMPRFGNKYKMFSHIIPSTELDITDLLYNCEEQRRFTRCEI